MAVDPGHAPREDTPQGMREYRVYRRIVVTVLAEDEQHAIYLASLGTKLWEDWDWADLCDPQVEAA